MLKRFVQIKVGFQLVSNFSPRDMKTELGVSQKKAHRYPCYFLAPGNGFHRCPGALRSAGAIGNL